MATDLNALTFGVEIECTIPAESLIAQNWAVGGYHSGCAIPGHDGWKAMHDGSIRAHYPMQGVEVVSPVLSGVEGLQAVDAMITKLRAMGARVNQSTGFHVHVGWNGTPEQLRRLICFVSFHEKALYASTGTTSRENGQYCSSIKYANVLADMTAEQMMARHMSRYHVLNLTNLATGRQRTVEFRVFAGTLNATKIAAYVQLCLGMVQKALDSTRKQLPWDAPTTARAERFGKGKFAMMTLLQHLMWRENVPVGRTAFGVVDAARLGAMTRAMLKMATQYDDRAAAAR